jgi:hypothetical protein
MTNPETTKPRLPQETAGVLVALLLIAVARRLTRTARWLGGDRVAAKVVDTSPPSSHDYGYYSVASLEQSRRRFEEHFALDSETFMRSYRMGKLPEHVSRHAANIWAGLCEELERLHDDARQPDELFAEAVGS